MIPVRLSLRNFMCYRDTEEVLDLTGVHLACLSGENGAGKSALLEAITWVLWGKARDRVMDDELISKGQQEMEVDYKFVLNGQLYRIVRKRAFKGKTGTTLLDVQVALDETGDSWRVLSGGTIRETQEVINNVLKLEYDTFINSAFILQGRADEFTTKNAADRKKVLADILGLGQYDYLEKRAREEAALRKSRVQELDAIIGQIDKELDKRPEYQASLDEVEGELMSAQQELADLRGDLAELVKREQKLETAQNRLAEIESRVSRRQRDISSAEVRITSNIARRDEYRSLIARRDEIVRGHDELRSAEASVDAMAGALGKLNLLEKSRSSWLLQVERARSELEHQERQLRRDIGEIERTLAGRGTQNQQLSEIIARLNGLEEISRKHEDTRCQRDALDVKMRALTAEKEACERDGKQIRQKLDLLLTAHAEKSGEVDCPLCGTGLTQDALDRVRRSYEHDIAEKRKDFEQKRSELEVVNREIIETRRRFDEEERQLRPFDEERKRQAEAEAKLRRMDEDEKTLGVLRSELAAISKRLEADEYAHEARREVGAIEREIAELGYDQAAHDTAREGLAVLRAGGYADLRTRLEVAERDLPEVMLAIEADERLADALREEQEDEQKETARLRPEAAQLGEVQDKVASARARETELASGVHELGERRGRLSSQVANCDRLKEEKGERLKDKGIAEDEKAAFDELAYAFGKKGIQAMIIENVIPELEEEANAILGRMTDGRMNVQFVTQRDAKTGKSVIETLDINISDEVGTRSYEMYSGGEAFRVNFAIRVALSKLLARRAGTQLQTLVIDEGFGSQDGQGREKLVGAIRSIEPDFEKILVITHIEELKDEFPVRINVVKTPTGSHITMLDE